VCEIFLVLAVPKSDFICLFQKGYNYVLYESPELTNTKSFEEDKNFWMPFFESANSRPDGNLEAVNAEMSEANNLHLKVIDEKYCCFIRAESLRYIYMVKKETLDLLDLSKNDLKQIENYNKLDFVLSNQLKKFTSLRMIVDETYGQIVSMKNVPIGKETPELYRMFENGQLWEERYIEPTVREGISRDKKLKVLHYFHNDSTMIPQEFHKNSTRIPQEFHKNSTFSCFI
jgi:hypothetical protein